eukprot:3944598-Amphidinium_carterae.1
MVQTPIFDPCSTRDKPPFAKPPCRPQRIIWGFPGTAGFQCFTILCCHMGSCTVHRGQARASVQAQTVDPACLTGVDDLLMLNDFNEAIASIN